VSDLTLPPVYTLRELQGHFVRMLPGKRQTWRETKSIKNADGLSYLCPVCFHRNKGSVGTEHILNWFLERGVPASFTPGPGRWAFKGTSLDDITFIGTENHSYSVAIIEHWHGYVENGTVRVDQVLSVHTKHKPSKKKRS
jgi:hypothetical protein